MSIMIVKVCLIYNHYKLPSAFPPDTSKEICDTELQLTLGVRVSENM